METVIIIIAIVLGIVGIIGSIVPGIPGPPISWLGLFVLYLWGSGTNGAGDAMSTSFLLWWLLATTVVTVLDYVIPGYFTKVTGGSKYGSTGAIIGMLLGLFIPPVGIFVGALLGAFAGELIFAGRDTSGSIRSALGALAGFLAGTGVKLIVTGIMLYEIIVYAF
ncbi:MAG: DUF456 domain-containing protein [Bacteroidales bacterium]|nr:DUF456 domain-containing protein [Bacteroidales bacterium]